jgi:hypothetical protein
MLSVQLLSASGTTSLVSPVSAHSSRVGQFLSQRTSNSTARAAVVDILLVKLSKGLTFNHHVDDR